MTPALDLTRPRSLPALLALTARTWIRHLPVFVVMSAVVVVPVAVIAHVHAGEDAAWPLQVLRGLVEAFVVPALVIATHVAAVQDLAAGRRPSVPRSLATAARSLPAAAAALAITTTLALVAAIALVVPMIYLLVKWYLVVGVVVVDGEGPIGAMERSFALTRGRDCWRVFALSTLGFAVGWAIAFATFGSVPASVATTAVVLSLTSLAGTLLLFDLRARTSSAHRASR